MEKRVVAQLLGLMDGLSQRQHVIVLAATNLPNMLDPALRRPGRFDREISIPIPDQHGREEILEIHSRGMPLAANVETARLAAITHGFVGADLEALCREAGMIALRRLLPQVDFSQRHIPYELLAQLEVTMEDFQEALREVEPSAIREVFVEVPDVGWDDVGGLEDVKQRLREAVEWPMKYADLFRSFRLSPPKGVLLSGPPGCGKTLIAKALAAETEVNFIAVKGPELMSMYVGESERGVREVFHKARQAAPCIVFFDEIDALASTRASGGHQDAGVGGRVLSQLLTELDGIEELKGVLVLAATNRRDLLDPALLRPGRFDLQIELPLPDRAAREKIFQVHMRDRPIAADVTAAWLAEQTQGFSGAEIEAVCHRAMMAVLAARIAAVAETAGRGTALEIRPGARAGGDSRTSLPASGSVSNMSDLHYYQYAFAQPDCRVQEIGPGVDARFDVELIGEGPIAAVVSRIGLDRFDPEKLQGKTPEEVRWLGEIAARHNEIICQAANSSRGAAAAAGDGVPLAGFAAGDLVALPADRGRVPAAASAIGRSGASNSTWRRSELEACGRTCRPAVAALSRRGADGNGLPDAKEGRTGPPAGSARRRAPDAPGRRGALVGQGRALLPHPHAAGRPDRPQRRNGLQRGVSVALVGARGLAGDRPARAAGDLSPGPAVGSERPLAPVPFLPELGVVKRHYRLAGRLARRVMLSHGDKSAG